MGLSLEEALAAATLNAAYSLDLQAEVGSLEVGKRADLVVLRSRAPARPACAWACPAIRDGGQGRAAWWCATARSGGVMRARPRRRGPGQDLPRHAQGARRWRRCAASRSRWRRASSSACSGPNGAGKSTTLGCITTLVRPTVGPHRGGRRRRGARPRRRPSAASRWCRRSRNLDRDLTVREVLTYHGRYFGLPAAERESRADRLLAEMQLADKADGQAARRCPAACSSGLMIARALMHDPQGAAPRRAHHRPRPAGAPPALGDAARPARARA